MTFHRLLLRLLQRMRTAARAALLLACTILISLTAYTTPHAAESVLYLHFDLAGTPLAATDANGNLVWKETYRPFGERINNSPASATGSGKNEIYFHGKQAESLNNGVTIQYFGARYYMPSVGRFLGVDPIHFHESNIHSFNRFNYGNNNPYRYRDPDGYAPNDLLREGKFAGTAGLRGVDRMLQIRQNEADLNAIGPRRAQARPDSVDVVLSKSRYPETTSHIQDALNAGRPSTLTIGQPGSNAARRREALKDTPRQPGKDRDEYPPAMFEQGGRGASVRHILPADNRGAGACIGAQCRGLEPGTQVNIKIVE